MFSNSAYEALYEYIGLGLHGKFIEIITSQKIFMAAILIIFSIMFFTTSAQFFSRYIPGNIVQRKSVPLSRYVRIIFCLFLGISLLRITVTTDVKKFNGDTWSGNSFVEGKRARQSGDIKVSFIFDLLSRSAEEFTALIARLVDDIFKTSDSQLDAPNFFYKAVMMAGSASISDPSLRESVDVYTSQCIERILGSFGKSAAAVDKIESYFGVNDQLINDKLAALKLNGDPNSTLTCLDAKNEVRSRLIEYAKTNSEEFRDVMNSGLGRPFNSNVFVNTYASSMLVDHFSSKSEGFLGLQKGASLPGFMPSLIQKIERLFYVDGWLTYYNNDLHGATLAASRAQDFSENLSRAPHVAGFIKMSLIAVFPWLVFALVAGHWRILVYWFAVYFSVLMWAPIWTLFYHIMMGISLSADTLSLFGRLSDGISLYSANVVTNRMNFIFATYSWIQLLIGTVFTGSFLWFLRPILSDSETPTAPEFAGDSVSAVKTVGRMI